MPQSDQPELPEGMKLLDRYSIIDRIARGGQSTIYRATDDRLDRVVCVKLLRLVLEGPITSPEQFYQISYSHFLQEAIALSKLQHPNTLRIYDFGYLGESRQSSLQSWPGREKRGRPFQVSEFLDGGNLEQFVRGRGPLKPDEVLAILERIAGALAEAHQNQIIHRDIKPSNILFSRVGGLLMPKLADFGIARCNLRKSNKPGSLEAAIETTDHVPAFSLRWAAPEQLTEMEEGPPTDVYALGLVTVFMLTGRAPFDGDDVKTTVKERVTADDYLTGRLSALGLSSEVRRVLIDAMRADPNRRTQSAPELHAQLNRALGGAPAQLPPPVNAPRPNFASITLDAVDRNERESSSPPPEKVIETSGRHVRIVEVHEKLDLTAHSATREIEVRFRVTLLPAVRGAPTMRTSKSGAGAPFRLHLKGLNCFVAKAGGRPNPAVVSDRDENADMISMARERISSICWYFGEEDDEARVFRIGDALLSLPYPEGRIAVALDLGPGREIVVICRRA